PHADARRTSCTPAASRRAARGPPHSLSSAAREVSWLVAAGLGWLAGERRDGVVRDAVRYEGPKLRARLPIPIATAQRLRSTGSIRHGLGGLSPTPQPGELATADR